MTIVNRLGTFFMWLGSGGVMIFILSDLAHAPIPALLFGGLACIGLGCYLWWRDPRQPAQPSNRFRLLKKRTKSNDPAQESRRRQQRNHEAEPPTPTRQE